MSVGIMNMPIAMLKRLVAVVATLAVVGAANAQPAPTTVLDPHQVYEKSCNSCHTEQGADLARQMLAVNGDRLVVARTGKELSSVIRNHHGVKPTTAEIAALSQLFRNGISWSGIYQHRCASCHGRAVSFARSTLKLQGGKIVGVKDGRDVASFLTTHGEATASEIGTLMTMLKWQLATVPKP